MISIYRISLMHLYFDFLGDYSKASYELIPYLKYVERRYGSDSVELGHEYLKYLGILKLDPSNCNRYLLDLSSLE